MTIARGSTLRYLLAPNIPNPLGAFPETKYERTRHDTRRGRSYWLRGEGRYADDDEAANLAMPISCARRNAHGAHQMIDTAEASTGAKVLAVAHGKDMEGVGSVSAPPADDRARRLQAPSCASAIARGEKVTHVGQPVAAVIAETLTAAAGCREKVRGE